MILIIQVELPLPADEHQSALWPPRWFSGNSAHISLIKALGLASEISAQFKGE